MKKIGKAMSYLFAPVFFLALIVGYSWLSPVQGTPVETTEEPVLSKYEVGPPEPAEILELVNAERAKVGVAPLTIDENVAKSARLKAEDMDKDNYFGHVMPSTGTVINAEMNELLVASCLDSSENYQGSPTETADTQRAIDWWKNSEPHYKAIINPEYSKTGIAVVKDVSRGYYISVQHFCISI